MRNPRQRWCLLLLPLAIAVLAAFKCDATDPFPRRRATFSIHLTGAFDTLASDGVGRWTDYARARDGSASHHLVLWADPSPGTSTAPRLFLGLTRQAGAPLIPGMELGQRAGVRVVGTLSLACPSGDAGGRCAAFLESVEGEPAPSLVLTRVDADTVAGRAEVSVAGWLPGTPRIGSVPPDTVRVVVGFTVARNAG